MISIIMGAYNGEKTICEAVDSILKQTYEEWEFIICDDCSTDNTNKLLQEYKSLDSRICIIRNEKNIGLAGTLNHCLKYVHGEYIARMDCDDISHPERLEKQIKYLQEHPELDLVGTYMYGFNENGLTRIINKKMHPSKYDIPKENPFHHATILMKADTMQKLGGYKVAKYTQRMEDVDLWYRFFAAGFQGETISEPLYWVRLDENAFRRRKLKYMVHASYIMWNGISMLGLPWYYKVYCAKPIISWILPQRVKDFLRR